MYCIHYAISKLLPILIILSLFFSRSVWLLNFPDQWCYGEEITSVNIDFFLASWYDYTGIPAIGVVNATSKIFNRSWNLDNLCKESLFIIGLRFSNKGLDISACLRIYHLSSLAVVEELICCFSIIKVDEILATACNGIPVSKENNVGIFKGIFTCIDMICVNTQRTLI